ncbi:myosin type-2 heavy chain 2 [Schizosaccharomyces japonicus yFS275]|uniref:Myosin type-2 heavy chain 2 n=1 Tax=Schizosaccharomyces japonicus (strain yFS275 / FY16936) TaxID=402676 RepID=B6K2G2_SCHJY|nr:myosin type-2 heavy chain 2 [Schizosaccharomyces japonicus yFS275]EEB07343.1 myosin type-2 heavy chain 2 [Schizosaccharomyces japonicus yFS275]
MPPVNVYPSALHGTQFMHGEDSSRDLPEKQCAGDMVPINTSMTEAARPETLVKFNEPNVVWVTDVKETYYLAEVVPSTEQCDSQRKGEREAAISDSQQSTGSKFSKNKRANDSAGNVTVRNKRTGIIAVVPQSSVFPVNPPKFDMVEDMAELTHLNEPSVVHNLEQRYLHDKIYTYSGLFMVAVNPYCSLPIYGNDFIQRYANESNVVKLSPHIYSVSAVAYRAMLSEGKDQAILVTGESGAGKTETTKKIIQFLTTIVGSPNSIASGKLEQQILMSNPILEAFGNAQTVRNNNSSRFGKFIRISFTESGAIAGASLEWYLLEKSRVIKQSAAERNYHIFYQMLKGLDSKSLESLDLVRSFEQYEYLKRGRKHIKGIDDGKSFNELVSGLKTIGFNDTDTDDLFRVIASILHIGNLNVCGDRSGQARFGNTEQVNTLCKLLGVSVPEFTASVLHPKAKAGKELVVHSRTKQQVVHSLQALSKSLYERIFSNLVKRLNQVLQLTTKESTLFIGVLDIAGFEIFDHNSFEQLCINYTNEKLQQYFNHYMFILEQEEYSRENIEWSFVDYGNDLQPTIDIIEKSDPVGIFSCLDEECVMPMATDATFTEKLHSIWKGKSTKYKPTKFLSDGFILTHYASDVEYNTEGWLEKNRDPLNESLALLLASSKNTYVANLFVENYMQDGTSNSIERKGMFRTVSQRHRRQLSDLMNQLQATQPHFVRCILPNNKKSSHVIDKELVLHQLRCNGVLEGIRIARSGFPNRLFYTEFRSRYGILSNLRNIGFIEPKTATSKLIEELNLDKHDYRLGSTKVFFKAGILANLEDRRNKVLQKVFTSVSAIARGFIIRRRLYRKSHKHEAILLLQSNLITLQRFSNSPWWKLFLRMKPLLGNSSEVYSMKKDQLIANLKKRIQELEQDLSRKNEELLESNERLQQEVSLKEQQISVLAEKETLVEELKAALHSMESGHHDIQQSSCNEAVQNAGQDSRYGEKDVTDQLLTPTSVLGNTEDLNSDVASYNSKMNKLVQSLSDAEDMYQKRESEIASFQKQLADIVETTSSPETAKELKELLEAYGYSRFVDSANSGEEQHPKPDTVSIFDEIQQLRSLQTEEASRLHNRISENRRLLDESIKTEIDLKDENFGLKNRVKELETQIKSLEAEKQEKRPLYSGRSRSNSRDISKPSASGDLSFIDTGNERRHNRTLTDPFGKSTKTHYDIWRYKNDAVEPSVSRSLSERNVNEVMGPPHKLNATGMGTHSVSNEKLRISANTNKVNPSISHGLSKSLDDSKNGVSLLHRFYSTGSSPVKAHAIPAVYAESLPDSPSKRSEKVDALIRNFERNSITSPTSADIAAAKDVGVSLIIQKLDQAASRGLVNKETFIKQLTKFLDNLSEEGFSVGGLSATLSSLRQKRFPTGNQLKPSPSIHSLNTLAGLTDDVFSTCHSMFDDENNKQNVTTLQKSLSLGAGFQHKNARARNGYQSIKAGVDPMQYKKELERSLQAMAKAERIQNLVRNQLEDTEESLRENQKVCAKYQQLYLAAEAKLREVEDVIEEKDSLMAELQRQRDKLLHQVEDFYSTRTQDLEDREKQEQNIYERYQKELALLKRQAEVEREKNLELRNESRLLNKEFGELRVKMDEAVLSRSNLMRENTELQKEIKRLSRQSFQLSETPNSTAKLHVMRQAMEQMKAETRQLIQKNDALEKTIEELTQRLDTAYGQLNGDSSSVQLQEELALLRKETSKKEELMQSILERMRQTETFANKTQLDSNRHREENLRLHRELGLLESQKKELELKLFELDTKAQSTSTLKDVKLLQKQLSEVHEASVMLERQKSKDDILLRNNAQTIRRLESQISQLSDERTRLESKVVRLEKRNAKLRFLMDDIHQPDRTSRSLDFSP